MIDYSLYFAENERPAIIPGAGWTPAFFPGSLTPNYIDLMENQDIARASSMFANFVVTTAFNNVAANTIRFAAFLCADPAGISLLTDPTQVIARSHDIFAAALGAAAVGKWVSIPLAPLSAYALSASPGGLRYLFLGMEVFVPATDFSTGGVTALLTPHALAQKPIDFPSGY